MALLKVNHLTGLGRGRRVVRVVPTNTAGVRRVPTLEAADAPCLPISGSDLVPWDRNAWIGRLDLAAFLMDERLSVRRLPQSGQFGRFRATSAPSWGVQTRILRGPGG
jgi:hypothetical protein